MIYHPGVVTGDGDHDIGDMAGTSWCSGACSTSWTSTAKLTWTLWRHGEGDQVCRLTDVKDFNIGDRDSSTELIISLTDQVVSTDQSEANQSIPSPRAFIRGGGGGGDMSCRAVGACLFVV